MRIAVQGVRGCFSEQAALRLRPQAEIVGRPSFAGIFAALAQGETELGLVPVENTLAGPIAETQTLLRQHAVEVIDEVRFQIEHCLMLHPASSLERVRQVLSHPVAFQQCGNFLSQHADWLVVPFFDTAGSVQEIMRLGSPELAAIASARAAEVYGATVALRDIGDKRANFTRFFLIAPCSGRVLPKEREVRT